MSGGGRRSGGGAGARVLASSSASSTAPSSSSVIPNSTKKTIQHIKDITENHSEDEIYAMLKECSMDPNETVTKLLLLDTYQEVKRKRDKRKDNLNKETLDSRWKSGTQSRPNHGGRSNHLTRHVSHESAARSSSIGKETGEKTSLDDKRDATPAASSNASIVNGPAISIGENPTAFVGTPTLVAPNIDDITLGSLELQPHVDCAVSSNTTPDSILDEDTSGLGDFSATSLAPLSASCLSTSERVLRASQDMRVVGTIKRDVGSHQGSVDAGDVSVAEKSGKFSSKMQGLGKANESPLAISALPHGSSTSYSRSVSNYNSRSQQLVGPQKVSSNKEWKPKPTVPTAPQSSGVSSVSEYGCITVEENSIQRPELNARTVEEEETSKLQKIDDAALPPRQHVIIPNHIHVPESERTKLSFGSFDANFGIASSYGGLQESEKRPNSSFESAHVDEISDDHTASKLNTTVDGDVVYSDDNPPPVEVPCNFSGNPAAAFETIDSQPREISCLSNFVVQQPLDPASYYVQYYRANAESNGRVSPFPSSAVPKYNGSLGITSQNPQEVVNPSGITTVGQTPLVTQATGLLQTSMGVTQQPLPVFRPPAGLPIPHYPPNYIPYGHYFSPYYVPPGIQQFLSNGTFSQQPPAGGLYPPAVTAPGVKYSHPQYKPGTNQGNSTQVAVPSGYSSYGSSPSSYNPGSPSTGGTATNEDLGNSQMFITGQQNDGSALWVGRDLPGFPVNSFYNIPQQGQHVAFAPAQGGHGAFANIYHPAQAVSAAPVHPLLQQSQAAEMVGPGASVYPPPQPQQMNWPSNY